MSMSPAIISLSQQQQMEERETLSDSAKMNGSSDRVASAADDVNSSSDRCEAKAIINENDNKEPASIITSTNSLGTDNQLPNGEAPSENKSSKLATMTHTDQVNAPPESELIPKDDHPTQHVEPNDNKDAAASDNTREFIQYQQQEQSISSDSLVQLQNEDSLQQPLLSEDEEGGESAVMRVEATSLDEERANGMEQSNEQQQQQMVNVDNSQGSEHGQIDEAKNGEEKVETANEQDQPGAGGESPIQSQKSNSNDENDASNKVAVPFLSSDRVMSLSPSLLRNNHQDQEEDFSPSPSVFHQQQQLQQQQYHQSPPLHYHQQQQHQGNNIISSPSRITYASPPGRRTIKLRLLEEIPSSLPPSSSSKTHSSSSSTSSLKTPFKSFRQIGRIRSLSLTGSLTFPYLNEDKSTNNNNTAAENGEGALRSHGNNTMIVMDRGTITVSWYDGTTSTEMQEHVFGCVLRKLNQSGTSSGKVKLEDVRLLDETVEPHEEVVLCPFLPDGSQFLLRFRTIEDKPERTILGRNSIASTIGNHHPFASRAPDSPSAEPSPHPSNANLVSLGGIHPQQLQVLNAAAAALLRPPPLNLNSAAAAASSSTMQSATKQSVPVPPTLPEAEVFSDANAENGTAAPVLVNGSTSNTTAEEETDDLIAQQLRQLNELFLQRRSGAHFTKSTPDRNDLAEEEHYHREEKKQVIFVIGNYLVLFMSLIALSAEIQSRLPQMMKWVQENYDSVQNCATDRDALVDCLSKGDFSGLVASFVLWATQSVVAKRIFLFGFDTPKKLWTVVYEALVSAVCWGISYLFIRRGLNPSTRQNFVHKYWKDAVYGSLAGFNAAFLKAILKNLVPQDVALEALEGRQLRIFNWLGQLLADE